MGNAVSPCMLGSSQSSPVKLVFWEGTTRVLTGTHVAGEIMFEHPEKMVCHADSFFIGCPIPSLAIEDELLAGHTYFVLPIDHFAGGVLSTSSLAAAVGNGTASKFADKPPFEYVRGAKSNGRVLIKVAPEFIAGVFCKGDKMGSEESPRRQSGNGFLCSTPELQKHYDQLVGSWKSHVWSPKLETISEYKIRPYSPCRFLGFKLKQTEG